MYVDGSWLPFEIRYKEKHHNIFRILTLTINYKNKPTKRININENMIFSNEEIGKFNEYFILILMSGNDRFHRLIGRTTYKS